MRWALIPVVALGVIPVFKVATDGRAGAAVLAVLADPASVLAARSPGARAPGAQLTKSKARRSADGVGRTERALAEALTRPLTPTDAPGAVGGTPGPTTGIIPDSPVTTAVDGVVPGGTPVVGAVGQPEGIANPIVGGFIPGGGPVVTPGVIVPGTPGGGGGGGIGEVPPPAPPPVTPVPEVPEPATWMTLVMGFGAVGGMLRARRRRARQSATLPG